MVSPQAKREAVTVLLAERDFGVTRACGLMGIFSELDTFNHSDPSEPTAFSRR